MDKLSMTSTGVERCLFTCMCWTWYNNIYRMHAFNSLFSQQWLMTIHPAPHICHSSRFDAPDVDRSNNTGLCGIFISKLLAAGQHMHLSLQWGQTASGVQLIKWPSFLYASQPALLRSPPPPLTSLRPAGIVSGDSHDFSTNEEWQTTRKETR